MANRRGNYATLFVFSIVTICGLGAMSIDTSYARFALSQTQDVADAASQAGMVVLRRTGDVDAATTAINAVVARNAVVGVSPNIDSINFGNWDHETSAWTSPADTLNGVRVSVSRKDESGPDYFLGKLFGWQTFNVSAASTSATQALHVILVMDITNSWSPANFNFARDASLAFLDTLETSYGDADMFGMTIFTNVFAWEFTPMTYVRDEVVSGAARATWEAMKTASKAGNGTNWPRGCTLNSGANQDNFNNPLGGCYPNMPREYRDEPGTDHTTGITLAKTMFEEQNDPTVFRAMVVLTDGQPNGINAYGTTRGTQGYVEERWREYRGPVPHTTTNIRADSVALTQDMWDEMQVHTWVVSFVSDAQFMDDMTTGQGWYSNTSSAAALVPIFEDIANSLPIAIVE